jgi:predicted dinucleotide-binding enzyme
MAMRIAIIGASGRMGTALAHHLVRTGHEVLLANSRGPRSLEERVAELGHRARAVTIADAVQLSEVVFLAIPYRAVARVAEEGDPWDDRVVVDVTNYYAERDGADLDPGAESSTSGVERRVQPAVVVKAFNTIFFERLANEARAAGAPGRLALPVAADDEDAKRLVMALVDEIGFDPVDAGTLADSRRQEPGAPVYNQPFDATQVRDALEQARAT